MHRHRKIIHERLISWFTGHPWLKIISFILAIILWFYAKGEISKFNY